MGLFSSSSSSKATTSAAETGIQGYDSSRNTSLSNLSAKKNSQLSVTLNNTVTDYGALELAGGIAIGAMDSAERQTATALDLAGYAIDRTQDTNLAAIDAVDRAGDRSAILADNALARLESSTALSISTMRANNQDSLMAMQNTTGAAMSNLRSVSSDAIYGVLSSTSNSLNAIDRNQARGFDALNDVLVATQGSMGEALALIDETNAGTMEALADAKQADAGQAKDLITVVGWSAVGIAAAIALGGL